MMQHGGHHGVKRLPPTDSIILTATFQYRPKSVAEVGGQKSWKSEVFHKLEIGCPP